MDMKKERKRYNKGTRQDYTAGGRVGYVHGGPHDGEGDDDFILEDIEAENKRNEPEVTNNNPPVNVQKLPSTDITTDTTTDTTADTTADTTTTTDTTTTDTAPKEYGEQNANSEIDKNGIYYWDTLSGSWQPTTEYLATSKNNGFDWNQETGKWTASATGVVVGGDGNKIGMTDEQKANARNSLRLAQEGTLPDNLKVPDALKVGGTDEDGNLIVPDLTTDVFEQDKILKAGVDEKGEVDIKAADSSVGSTSTVDMTKLSKVGISDATSDKAKVTETFTGDLIVDTSPIIEGAEKILTNESNALAKVVNVAKSGVIDSATVEIPVGALIEKVTGKLSEGALAPVIKISGMSLAKITRAKEQLRTAGLTKEQIDAIGNDPEDLEARLVEFTEEERGLIGGLPKQALVSTQMASLLEGVESGNIPVWASPAVSAVESMLAERGLSASTVGRNDLINGIITAAIPIANANATAIQTSLAQEKSIEASVAIKNAELANTTALNNAQNVFQLNMAQFAADEQREILNSKFLQTVSLTEASFDQESFIKSAVLLSQENLTQADIDQKRVIQHAQAFLEVDLSNLNNKQQGIIIAAQQSQERLLSNQASTNASLQINAQSINQTNKFMASLEAEISKTNVTQENLLKEFNATQTNLVAAKNADRTVDVNKFNANLSASLEEFNSSQEFNRNQFNLANSAAVKQSNLAWRRQTNVANTAAQNAVNMQNVQNALGVSAQATAFVWQELRDSADYDFRAQENEYTRISQLVSTAIGSDPERYGNLQPTITALIGLLS